MKFILKNEEETIVKQMDTGCSTCLKHKDVYEIEGKEGHTWICKSCLKSIADLLLK